MNAEPYTLDNLSTDMSNIHTAMTEDTGKIFACQVVATVFKFGADPKKLGEEILALVTKFEFGE